MHKIPVWLEQFGNTTIDTRRVKEIPIKSTGHDKIRLTVALIARDDGKNLKPYVIIPRKSAIMDVEEISDVICSYNTKSWMDDSLMTDYLLCIIGQFLFQNDFLCRIHSGVIHQNP